jgi:predicted RNA-binding Zn ribbon-like protein
MTTDSPRTPDLIGGHAALDLVNTVSWRLDNARRRDNLHDLPALAEWCQRAGLLDDVAAQEVLSAESGHPRRAQQALQDARALRELLHDLLAHSVDDGEPFGTIVAPSGLQDMLVDALAHSDLVGPPMHWQLTPHQAADLPRLLALQGLDLLQTPQLHLIRRCHGAGCGWLFLDRTRSHTRRWCSSSDCGNRDRARRHYAKHLEKPARKQVTRTKTTGLDPASARRSPYRSPLDPPSG